jgi:hypothetical protein
MKYLEDIQIGEKADLGAHTFTAEEIKSFAQRFDRSRSMSTKRRPRVPTMAA